MEDRIEPVVHLVPTSRWRGTGTVIVGFGCVAYLLAFILPSWGSGPEPGTPGYMAFLLTMSGEGGEGGRLAWVANPFLWVALVINVVWRRRNVRGRWGLPGFRVGAFSTGAAVLAIAGTLLFMADYPSTSRWPAISYGQARSWSPRSDS